MTEFTSGVPYKPAPSRRRYLRAIILAFCGTLALSVVIACCAITVVVAAVFNGLGGMFQGIGEAIASTISMATVLFVLVVFPWLMELASLLSTGQLIPFVARVFQLLFS